MKTVTILGIIIATIGAFGFYYGSFVVTEEKEKARLGPVTVNVKDEHVVNIPTGVGIGAILLGIGLVVWSRKAA